MSGDLRPSEVEEIAELLESEGEAAPTSEGEWPERRPRPAVGLLSLFAVMAAGTYLAFASADALLGGAASLSGTDVLGHVVLLVLGVGCVLGGVALARKSIVMDHFVGRTFEDQILPRMDPLLAQAAGVEGRLDELGERLEEVSLGLHRAQRVAGGEGSREAFEALLRYTVLANLTVGLFLFSLLFQEAYVPYAITALYVLWWGAVTADFGLWKNSEIWAWAVLPILTVPVVSILMFVVVRSLPVLLTVLATALALYVYGYYAWARYKATGALPLRIHRGEVR